MTTATIVSERIPLQLAKLAANAVIAYMEDCPAATHVEVAGSIRRGKSTVKDVDIVATGTDTAEIMQHFVDCPDFDCIKMAGPTRASAVLISGVQVDIRVVTPDQYPFTLLHFTGSAENNIALRIAAKRRGLKLNEYGLFDADGNSTQCATEAEIFAALGLPYVAPAGR